MKSRVGPFGIYGGPINSGADIYPSALDCLL
jgi:hypothetical protein